MPRDFFDPMPEQQNVVLIDAATLSQAEKLIESCEHCNPSVAEIPFCIFRCGRKSRGYMIGRYDDAIDQT
jgi:hypothetical protein